MKSTATSREDGVTEAAIRTADPHEAEPGRAGSKSNHVRWHDKDDRAARLHLWRGHGVVGDHHTD